MHGIEIYKNFISDKNTPQKIIDICTQVPFFKRIEQIELTGRKSFTNHSLNITESVNNSTNTSSSWHEELSEIDKFCSSLLNKTLSIYAKKYDELNVGKDLGFVFAELNKEDFWRIHVDDGEEIDNSIKKVMWMLILNDTKKQKGGDIIVNGKKIKLNKTDILMLPVTYIYPWEITPVESGSFYSISTWVTSGDESAL